MQEYVRIRARVALNTMTKKQVAAGLQCLRAEFSSVDIPIIKVSIVKQLLVFAQNYPQVRCSRTDMRLTQCFHTVRNISMGNVSQTHQAVLWRSAVQWQALSSRVQLEGTVFM